MKKNKTLDTLPLKVSGIDENHLMYGNFIGVQYVFETSLDLEILKSAIERLLRDLPYLGGRYDKRLKLIVADSDDTVLKVNPDCPAALSAYSRIGSAQPDREDFIHEPKRQDVLAGKAPLSTFTYTKFVKGGCIFGMAISHVLVDAAGFHLIANRLADIYSALKCGAEISPNTLTRKLDVFKFGSGAAKPDLLMQIETAGLPKPVKVRGPVGGILSRIIMAALSRMMTHDRYVLCLSLEQVQALKQTALKQSGEEWLSTNVALCAHFTKIVSKLMLVDSPKTEILIGQLLDLRGRYFEADRASQAQYIGNAILIDTQRATFETGLQTASLGEIARLFKRRIQTLSASYLKARLDMTEDSLSLGYTYPGLDLKNPMIAVNNQTKMDVYGLNFLDHNLLRVIPQDVGDNIMFFPAPDGGVEIYIRDVLKPSRQSELSKPEWQAEIFSFED